MHSTHIIKLSSPYYTCFEQNASHLDPRPTGPSPGSQMVTVFGVAELHLHVRDNAGPVVEVQAGGNS